jgi:hypothetical protein
VIVSCYEAGCEVANWFGVDDDDDLGSNCRTLGGGLVTGSDFILPTPPHVPYGLRGLPSRLWPKCN